VETDVQRRNYASAVSDSRVYSFSSLLAYCTIFVVISAEVVDLHICMYLYQSLFVPVYTYIARATDRVGSGV